MSGVAPAVGHFHTMLEAARAAKTNKKNADIGDLGQRLRLAWKQACLIDQRAGAFVASKVKMATREGGWGGGPRDKEGRSNGRRGFGEEEVLENRMLRQEGGSGVGRSNRQEGREQRKKGGWGGGGKRIEGRSNG